MIVAFKLFDRDTETWLSAFFSFLTNFLLDSKNRAEPQFLLMCECYNKSKIMSKSILILELQNLDKKKDLE